MAYGEIRTSSGRRLTLTPDLGWVNGEGQAMVPPPGQVPGQMSLADLNGLDYASPIDVMGVKGYRIKNKPDMVQLSDGRMVQLGVDLEARRKSALQALELESKSADLDSKKLQNRLTLAQLTDMRGDENQVDNTRIAAMSAGVPAAPGDPLAGMSRKSREALQSKMYATGDKQVSGIEQEAREARQFTNDAQRFQQLNANTSTGPVSGSTPVAWVRKALGNTDLQEMDAISSKLVPRMRVPGSGTTSDFDARMFQRSTLGVDKDKPVNDSVAAGYVANGKMLEDRADFMRAYLEANGTLRGADQNWSKYLNANPIFDPTSPEVPKINGARRHWRQFFSGESTPTQPGGRPALESFVR